MRFQSFGLALFLALLVILSQQVSASVRYAETIKETDRHGISVGQKSSLRRLSRVEKAEVRRKIRTLKKRVGAVVRAYYTALEGPQLSIAEVAKFVRRIDRLRKRVDKLTRRLGNKCITSGTTLSLTIENKSALDLDVQLLGAYATGKTIGSVRPESIVSFQVPAWELLYPSKSNKKVNYLVMNASFGGESIQDPKIAKSIDRAFKTPKYPKPPSCVFNYKIILVNSDFGPSVIIPPGSGLSTNSWAGNWHCDDLTFGYDGEMTISGNGAGSIIQVDFPTWIWAPAYELYVINKLFEFSAEGTMTLYDQHAPGEWGGTFTITISGDKLGLTRHDNATSASSTFSCTRK